MDQVGYVATLSLVTPPLSAWQMAQVTQFSPTLKQWIRGSSPPLWGGQMVLRTLQLGAANQLQQHHSNPWLNFGVMGLFQSVIYGHANTHYAEQWQLGHVRPLGPHMLRGLGLGAARDMISQGVPFACAQSVLGMAGWSIAMTLASQGLHNWQTTYQLQKERGLGQAWRTLIQQHSWHATYRGVNARWTLMLVHNFCNYQFLHRVWNTKT